MPVRLPQQRDYLTPAWASPGALVARRVCFALPQAPGGALGLGAEGLPMIVEPFRSKMPDSETYHTNTNCPDGEAIAPGERRRGDGGLGECDVCRSLSTPGPRHPWGKAADSDD